MLEYDTKTVQMTEIYLFANSETYRARHFKPYFTSQHQQIFLNHQQAMAHARYLPKPLILLKANVPSSLIIGHCDRLTLKITTLTPQQILGYYVITYDQATFMEHALVSQSLIAAVPA